MGRTAIEKLLSAIHIAVHNEEGPYKEKVKAILAECNEGDKNNLEEFVSWFADIDWDEVGTGR